jgi:hypothetical protein
VSLSLDMVNLLLEGSTELLSTPAQVNWSAGAQDPRNSAAQVSTKWITTHFQMSSMDGILASAAGVFGATGTVAAVPAGTLVLSAVLEVEAMSTVNGVVSKQTPLELREGNAPEKGE